MGISVVIPAYNEEGRIERVIREVTPYAEEIIVVDDCSMDNTADVAKRLHAKVVSHNRNRGHKEAVKTGFKAASEDVVVTIDADGEYPADQIPKLVAPIAAGAADLVSGARQHISRISERMLTSLTRLVLDVSDTGGGFKALNGDLAKTLELKGFCICGIFLLEAARKGGTVLEVPVKRRSISKPKAPAWHHLPQLLYVLREIVLSFRQQALHEGKVSQPVQERLQ